MIELRFFEHVFSYYLNGDILSLAPSTSLFLHILFDVGLSDIKVCVTPQHSEFY